MESDEEPPCPSPYPYTSSSSSSLFRDISNFKTPKPKPPRKPNAQTPGTQFFTASKQTPRVSSSSSSSIRRRPSLALGSKTARRLKALEIEQSQSARKVLVDKERSLKSLAKSITVWLNFLVENPGSCGCDLSSSGRRGRAESAEISAVTGKRDSFPGIGVSVDVAWRDPKRQRDSEWRGGDAESVAGFSSSAYSGLRNSLKDVCSFEDLTRRMRIYLSLSGCKEVFDVMSQVAKNIDEGRLKMKAHCPLVTDVGLKEKATKILMGYNPVWLRIGLYIVFGGDSLLSDGDDNSDQEVAFLRMMIEKQFYTHAGLAKAYAYNKMVEGLYRPGYYEALGNIVLKRFLLLVLVLDRAKSQTSLPLKYGIDGVDGGSPMLFKVQSKIKSSRQVVCDFLSSDTMLGEGNVVAHLMIVGYKLSYQQSTLIEYNFKVSDLFVDLQDGVRLCRVTHLLLDDPSILTKLVVPSDTSKKHLANCSVALRYLRQSGVSLYDDDGVMIVGDDIANGDKELILSLLWNTFVHLQLPHLMKKTMLVEEICKIQGANMEHFNTSSSTPLELLLSWIKAVCQNYNCRIDGFSSLVDGKTIWCVLDYYFRKELPCSSPSKEPCKPGGKESIVLATDYPDAVHNFLLTQKLIMLLGNFPEVLQISDILEYGGACSDKSVVILLVFLASQVIVKKNMDQLNFHKLLGCPCQSPRKYSSTEPCLQSSEEVGIKDITYGHSTEDVARKFKAIQAWWQDLAERDYQPVAKPAASMLNNLPSCQDITDIQRDTAAKVIQTNFRRAINRSNYVKMKTAASLLQTVIRAWLVARKKPSSISFCSSQVHDYSCEHWNGSKETRRYSMLITDRHCFVKFKKSVLLIQRAVRFWITWRQKQCGTGTCDISELCQISASVVIQKHFRGWLARSRCIHEVSQIETSFPLCQKEGIDDQHLAATKIQSHFRGWLLRRRFQNQKQAVLKIQNSFRMLRCVKSCQRTFQNKKQAILKIQSSFRMLKCLKTYQQHKSFTQSAVVLQSYVRHWIDHREACRRRQLIIAIQKHCRGWLARRNFLFQREAVVRIQSAFRGLKCRIMFKSQRHAAFDIQRFVRGEMIRKKILGTSCLRADTAYGPMLRSLRGCNSSFERKLVVCSVVKLQMWWRGVSLRRLKTKSAIIIQSHIRGWIARRNATRQRLCTCTPNLRSLDSSGSGSGTANFEMKALVCSVIKLQVWWRGISLMRRTKSAIIIQSHIRGWIARRNFSRLRLCACTPYSPNLWSRSYGTAVFEMKVMVCSVIKLQAWWRGVSLRRRTKSAVIIQSHVRGWISRRNVTSQRLCACTPRGPDLRTLENHSSSFEMRHIFSVLKLQRWWRVMSVKLRTKSALIMQSHIRGWIARRKANILRHHIVVIQSYWKGFLVRKESREHLRDLRLRMEKTAANIDDGMRIINRLIAAVSDLLSKKSISDILRTVETLDMATQYSQKCCEELVKARAINTLLELIRSVSRSVPDQEVLKHALSTLRNLARYPHLVEVLLDCRKSVETILLQLLRNKDEGYFIASQLMKKICLNPKGIEAVQKSPALLKRLHHHVEELTVKAQKEKRFGRVTVARENADRRLKEAVSLLKIVAEG